MLVQIGVQIFTDWSTDIISFIHKCFNHIALLQENLEILKVIQWEKKKIEPWMGTHLFISLLTFDNF